MASKNKFKTIKPKNMFTGQFDTDRYIADYFSPDFVGTCIDVGSAQPVNGNNSYYFERRGWTVYCIEPNPAHMPALRANRKHVYNFACGNTDIDEIEFTLCTLQGGNQEAISSLKIDERLLKDHAIYNPTLSTIKVPVKTLNTFISEVGIATIDLMSIDTEGTELDVLKGFDIAKYKPKLMVIENNYNEPYIEEYLKDYGYIKHNRVMVNDFYLINS